MYNVHSTHCYCDNNITIIHNLFEQLLVTIISERMEASKKMIYVGGLADEVDSKVLNAAFIPFGDIVEVNLPIDYETEKHRGFAFIEFELAEDASAAIDNMNDGEMFGRQLRVNLAKPMRNKEGGNRWEYFALTF